MSIAGFKHSSDCMNFQEIIFLGKIKRKIVFRAICYLSNGRIAMVITLGGMNIIWGLLEIIKYSRYFGSISQNLFFLRFYLKKGFIEHNVSSLAISSTSYYYDSVIENPLYDNIFG